MIGIQYFSFRLTTNFEQASEKLDGTYVNFKKQQTQHRSLPRNEFKKTMMYDIR